MISSICRNLKLKTDIREGFLILSSIVAMQSAYAANYDLNLHSAY
jgi:hypothetical protein